MNPLRASLSLLVLSSCAALAQNSPPPPPTPAAAQSLTAEELEQLLAPIALYPDALIALILPATVASIDVVLAARHVRDFPNDRSQVEHRAWDESVKSLTHYPEVLKWMDENLPWTKQVGEAFATQPAAVMQTVQRLRARARTAGTLVDTPQQQVLAEPEVIRIVPVQPNVIYIPRYEPDIVFIHEPVYYQRPLLTFGVGVAAGSWLAYDCDWRRNTIWVGDRHRTWRGHDWQRPVVVAPPPPGVPYGRHDHVRPWQAPRHTSHHPHNPSWNGSRFNGGIVRPAPIGMPATHRTWGRSDSARLHTVPPSARPANHTPVHRVPPMGRPSSSTRHSGMPNGAIQDTAPTVIPIPTPPAQPPPPGSTVVTAPPTSRPPGSWRTDRNERSTSRADTRPEARTDPRNDPRNPRHSSGAIVGAPSAPPPPGPSARHPADTPSRAWPRSRGGEAERRGDAARVTATVPTVPNAGVANPVHPLQVPSHPSAPLQTGDPARHGPSDPER